MTGINVSATEGRHALATAWLLAALVVGVSSSTVATSVDTAAAKNDPSLHRRLQAPSHYAGCGKINGCPNEPDHFADDADLHEIRCCSDANPTLPPYSFTGRWDVRDPRRAYSFSTSGFVCPYTESPEWDTSNRCPVGTYQDAVAVCAEVPGARLCTAREVLNDCARGTGCGHDVDLIWTSTTEEEAGVTAKPPLEAGWSAVFANDFDDGTWQNFAPGGADVTLNALRLWNFGFSAGSLRLVDNNQMTSSAVLNLTAANVDLAAYDIYQVQFWWYIRSFENDEDFFLEYCPDGVSCELDGSWQVLGQWEHCCTPAETSNACLQQTGCDFDNEDAGFHTVSMPTSGRDPHLRFRSDSSGAGDYLYIDQVEIIAKGTGELAPSASPSAGPSVAPTIKPSVTGSDGPSAVPTSSPSDMPSADPTATPSAVPTSSPSDEPSSGPTVSHSGVPTISSSPSSSPTSAPSASPTIAPTPSYGWETVFVDDFDTDWGHFFAGGEGNFVTRNTRNTWKKYNFRNSDGGLMLTSKMGMNSSAIVDLTPFLDNITAYDLARVKFHWYARSFENDEDYFVELCADGLTCEASSSWEVLGQYERCCTPEERVSGTWGCKTQTTCDFNNDESGFHKINLPKPIGSNPHLRIRMDASGTGDQLFVDNFELQVRGTGEHAPSSAPSQSPTTNECTADNGGCDQLCTDLTGEADPRECDCYGGFVLGADGTSCVNIDECATGEHQCAQLCSDLTPDPIDSGLKFECNCEEGYRLVSDDPAATQCEDVNECTDGLHDCHSNASCENTVGSYTCTCDAGYSGDGKNCTEINECLSGPCLNGGICTDLVDAYSCNCTGTGYKGSDCNTEIDECNDADYPHACHEQATCNNTQGSYECFCNPGWEGTGFACADIDYCASTPCANGDCEELTDGTYFTCLCDGTGYQGELCDKDIDECLVDNGGCDPLTECTNELGNRTCGPCPSGFSGTGDAGCLDIDECANASLNNCHDNAFCTNDPPGGYTCTCNGGYEGNGVECTQLDATSLYCPAAGQQVDVNLDFGGILTVTPSATGTLCTLTEVRTTADGSEDGQVIPIARSYEGHLWESSAGDLSTSIFKDTDGQLECLPDGSSCQMLLPPLADPATYRYALTSYEYSPSRRDRIARALSRLTFGATPTDLNLHDKAEVDSDSEAYLAAFIQEQMDEQITPMTSHREYFRKRTNPKLTHATRGGRPDHPCDAHSRWRRYSFIRHDREILLTDTRRKLFIEYDADEVASLPTPALYEAEAAVMVGYKADTKSAPKDSYYYGDFFANHAWGKTGEDGYIEFTVTADAAQDYEIAVRYSNFDRYSDRPIDLVVNNVTAATLPCPFTLGSDYWRYTKLVSVPLKVGENKIRVVATTDSSVDIDHLRVGRLPAAILKINGHVRAVVPDGLAFLKNPLVTFDPQVAYEFCDIDVPTVNKPQGMIEIRDPTIGACSSTDLDFDKMNPPVDFTGYEQYIPGVLFDLPSNTDSSDWIAHVDEQEQYHQVTDTDYLLINGINDEAKCSQIPTIMKEDDLPVFAKLPDGTYLQWTPQLILDDNTPGNNIADGGGEVQLASGGEVRCSNVPRSIFNEESCKLSIGDIPCTQTDAAVEVDVVLNEENIRSFFPLIERYVYAIKGLVLGDPATPFEESPCLTTDYTRWEKTTSACDVETPLQPETTAALTSMLSSTSDTGNLYLTDVKFPAGASCHADDEQKLGISITVSDICYTQVHRNHLSVYDATGWAGPDMMMPNKDQDKDAHPGKAINVQKWAECYHNPETFDLAKCTQGNRTDFDGWSLTFPSNSNFAPQHGMERWYENGGPPYWIPVKSDNDGSGKGSRFGDIVNYRDLITDLTDPAVANALGGSDFVSVSDGVVTCGSVGEVANDPTFGAMFDAENNKEETTSEKDHEQQKTKIWTKIALESADQLRQRMAWALSQILTIVPGNIDATTETEIYVSYYDIFVRNAFGNYLDILKEISFSPLQAEHLTYLASKSHAYIFQDEDKRVSSADENFAREISQLFTTGLVMLNQDGTPMLDNEGNTIDVYDNEDIMSFARGWTGFQRFIARGNIESRNNNNRLDPMYIVQDWRDRFPKTDLQDGYIGDGYPLCTDLPGRMFLRKGAKYRLLGPNPLPELVKDNPDFANPNYDIKRFVLKPGPLRNALSQVGGEWKGVVVLPSNLSCTDTECDVDTVRVVKVDDIYYEYVAPPCVQQAFYNGAKGVARYYRTEEGTMCANPRLPHASEACCDPNAYLSLSLASRNYFYDGERVTYNTAEERCGSLCVYKDMDGVVPRNRRHTGYHWTPAHCNIQVKINREGYVAIVHDLDTVKMQDSVPLHVSEESLNYFKVFWADGFPSKVDNNCGDCQVLSDGACLCQTSVAEEAVFSSAAETTADGILSSLQVGHMDPAIFDTGAFVEEIEADFTAYVKSAGSYDVDTVFKVDDEATGRTLFFRNLKSTVSLQGWTYEPEIFEAETANNMTDVEVKSGYSRWTGSGYVDFGATSHMNVEWKVTVPADVDVTLKFRYTNYYNNRPMEVVVNGVTTEALLDFLPTGAWDYWTNTAPVTASLKAGENIVRLQYASAWPTNNGTLDESIGNENDWTGLTQVCQGDCDRDEDCAEGLYCYKRDHGTPHVPGCLGEPTSDGKDFCVSNAYRYSEGGPNVDHLLIEGVPTDHPTYSFPNPVHFMGLLQDYYGDGIGETNRRDAEYETSAILEHYFYHPNTAPFVCIRLMQRAGFSNPSPRYVEACSKAFRTGAYTTSGGVSFGSGKYGDLAATAAAIHLDREANSPVLDLEPGFGALREPLLKPIGLMRALEYADAPRENFAELWFTRNRFGQEPYEFPTVFSYFLPEYIPSSTPASAASHVSPESMLLDMPSSIDMLNGLFSLVKYGLTDCYSGSGFSQYPGYGSCNDNGMYERASGIMEWLPLSTNATDFIDEYATLLTAGRLSPESREKIKEIHDAELHNTECSAASAYRQNDYRGFLNVTKKGYQCQKWTDQTPNAHTRTPERFQHAGLGDHNYCRNPDSRSGGAYCYVNSAETDRDYCDVPTCGNDHSARRLALQAILTTPEFHSTAPTKPAVNKDRPAPTAAAPPSNEYKAIVYLFFSGGADTWNMMPPYPGACSDENDLYAKYKAIRGNVALTMEGPDGLNGTADDLHQLPVTGNPSNCSAFGLHQNLAFLKDLYDQEEALMVANTGLLLKPVDKSNYKKETPTQIFAHNSMQKESKSLDLENEIRGTGIIGRIADSMNSNGYNCGTYSISGNQIALVGEPGVSPSPVILSKSGLKEFDPQSSSKDLARLVSDKYSMSEVIRSLNNATSADSNFFGETWSLKLTEAMDQYAEIYNALESTYVPSGFPDTGFAEQLRMVTQLMQSRAERGKDRDIFYVDIGGWDTHSYVLDELIGNFGNVNAAIEAFVNEVKSLGLWQSTTLMQFSEFARTLDPNSGPQGDGTGAGSDHGWGGNNFIISGALKGKQILGEYPTDFTEEGERALSRGRLIPKTPWDAVFNGVAEWFGVLSPEELDKVMPHRKNFMPPLNDENLLFDKNTLYR